MAKKGYLILENNSILEGESFGIEKDISGEVVFNTGMTGYPESLTDPSYYGQILTMTYPLIGNYGVPKESGKKPLPSYFESDKIHIRGLIVSTYVNSNTHWQSGLTLSDWLKNQNVPALSGIDTRSLTKIIRETGVMKGIITFGKPRLLSGLNFIDINKDNLVSFVSCKTAKIYGNGQFRILMFDCGLKYSQIKKLLKLNTTIIRVPWNYDPFSKETQYQFDAIMISNGPGDARLCKETILHIKEAITRKIPILGICLGNQILALAAGGDIYKMKYGHRSQNQPVIDHVSGKCFITSQNHGFAVDMKTLPRPWQLWFSNLNDFTNEGIRHPKLPIMSSQFHPEASPGPIDTEWIFKYFLEKAKKWLKIN